MPQQKIKTLPRDILNLIRKKNQTRREYHRSGAPQDRQRKNRLQALVKLTLNNHRKDTWNSTLNDLMNDEGHLKLWQIKKRLTNKTPTIPPIHGRNGLVFSDTDKAEAFVDNLEDQCSPSYKFVNIPKMPVKL